MLDTPDKPRPPDPCSLVIFGVTGDLTHRLITPALYNLAESNLLPEDFCLVGVVRKPMTADELCSTLVDGLQKYSKRPIRTEIAERLFGCVTALQADPSEPASFDRLSDELANAERAKRTRGNRLFYLATPPDAFAPIARELGSVGLLHESDGGPWRRLVIEKPFGTDLASARRLDGELLKIMTEHQIYRIDHYLGKETVQNILVLALHQRPVRADLESQSHRPCRDHGRRKARRRSPRRLLRLNRRVARHGAEPSVPAPVACRDGAAGPLRRPRGALAKGRGARGNPDARAASRRCATRCAGNMSTASSTAKRFRPIAPTPDVAPDSATETYVALKLAIDNWRWAGVPFYLRTGKALARKRTEVAIKFKHAPVRDVSQYAGRYASPTTI